MLVAKYVDEAIYVIMSDYARTSVVAEGLRELKNTGIEISGYVLNGSKESSGGYGYHNYGYGSKYYGYKDEEAEEEKANEEAVSINEEASQETVQEEPAEEKRGLLSRRARKENTAVVEQQEVPQASAQQRPVMSRRAKRESAYVGKHGRSNKAEKKDN